MKRLIDRSLPPCNILFREENQTADKGGLIRLVISLREPLFKEIGHESF
jgi:hypothetical protein